MAPEPPHLSTPINSLLLLLLLLVLLRVLLILLSLLPSPFSLLPPSPRLRHRFLFAVHLKSKSCFQTLQLTQLVPRPRTGSMKLLCLCLCLNGPINPPLLRAGLSLRASMPAQSATGDTNVKSTSTAIYYRCIVARTSNLICAITVANDSLDGQSRLLRVCWLVASFS